MQSVCTFWPSSKRDSCLLHNFGFLVVMFCSQKCPEFKADSRCLASFKLQTPGLNIYIFFYTYRFFIHTATQQIWKLLIWVIFHFWMLLLVMVFGSYWIYIIFCFILKTLSLCFQLPCSLYQVAVFPAGGLLCLSVSTQYSLLLLFLFLIFVLFLSCFLTWFFASFLHGIGVPFLFQTVLELDRHQAKILRALSWFNKSLLENCFGCDFYTWAKTPALPQHLRCLWKVLVSTLHCIKVMRAAKKTIFM